MSLRDIRRAYNVPAHRGARVVVDWYPPEPAREGTVTGSDGARLRVRLDGESRSRIAHPTWRVTYMPNTPVQGAAKPSPLERDVGQDGG